MESKRKVGLTICVAALGLLGALPACRRVPVWPAELAEQMLDPGGVNRPERLEFRRFAEVCPSSTCASLEITWWASGPLPDARVVGARVIQLGGLPASAELRPPGGNNRSVSVVVLVKQDGLFSRAQARQSFNLSAAGEFQVEPATP